MSSKEANETITDHSARYKNTQTHLERHQNGSVEKACNG